MKFINFLQISAIAMSAAVDAAEPHFHEPHSLRGPVMVADAEALGAHKPSSSGNSKSSNSSNKSSSNKSSSNKSSNSSSGKSGSSSDSSSDKSSSYKSDSRSAGTRAVSSKSTKSPTVPALEDIENFPEFFPSDMNKEKMTEEQIEYWNDYDNGNNGYGKKTASQKRQEQRDRRREFDNPDRSQAEENRERARKTEQSQRSGNPGRDPYAKDNGFGAEREAKRIATCERDYRSCRYSGPNSYCYNDCITGNQRVNQECADYCRFVDAECYDACRGGNGVGYCVDSCNVSIERESDRRRIFDRSDRSDYRQVDRCEGSCRSWNINSNKYRSCMLDCDVIHYDEDDELYFPFKRDESGHLIV